MTENDISQEKKQKKKPEYVTRQEMEATIDNLKATFAAEMELMKGNIAAVRAQVQQMASFVFPQQPKRQEKQRFG